MNKTALYVGIGVGVPMLVALTLPVANLFDTGRRGPEATGDPRFVEVSHILQGACADCHASGVAEMPFYARLPVASGMIAADQADAERWWRLDPDKLSGKIPLDDADLGHIELVLAENNMPPGKYVVMHWGAGLSSAEKTTLRNYIAARRSARPEAALVAEAHRGEPVQPVMLPAKLQRDKSELGDRLYHETMLSGNDTLSCASCHQLTKGGTDQDRVSTGIHGQKGPINAPTTLNSSYNVLQFWDGRAASLQDQAGGPVENPLEMGAKFPAVVTKLQADDSYVTAFAKVYPKQGISKETITNAIAEYERSLVTPDSPFDKYLRGDDGAIDASAKRGYQLFKDVGCAACHNGPALGGTSFQRFGIAADYFAARGNVTDADQGRMNVTHDERDRHVFKVPTLRNLKVTHPYFHDGSAATLEDAVRTMAKYQRGRDLSDDDVTVIVAFLVSLTGERDGTPVDKL